jgi:4-hydroxybenzoate polyprenyltransferase
VKSTARLFGSRTRFALLCFYPLAVLLIGLSGAAAGAGPLFVIGCVLFGAHLGWQIERLDIDDPDSCLRIFKSNRDAGLILFAALTGDALCQSYFS